MKVRQGYDAQGGRMCGGVYVPLCVCLLCVCVL